MACCLGPSAALLGTAIGVTFTAYISEIEQKLTRWTGQEIFDRKVYYFKDIPTDIQPTSVAAVVLGAVAIAVVFSIMPARTLRCCIQCGRCGTNEFSGRPRGVRLRASPPRAALNEVFTENSSHANRRCYRPVNLHKTYRKNAVVVPVLAASIWRSR